MKTLATAILALTMFAFVGHPEAAEQRIGLGDLICTVGSPQQDTKAGRSSDTQNMVCVFRNGDTGAEETYKGTMRTLDGPQTFSEKQTLLWIVSVGADTKITAGFLNQNYGRLANHVDNPAFEFAGETKSAISLRLMPNKKEHQKVPVIAVNLALAAAPA